MLPLLRLGSQAKAPVMCNGVLSDFCNHWSIFNSQEMMGREAPSIDLVVPASIVPPLELIVNSPHALELLKPFPVAPCTRFNHM